jgi:hypothetical protein
MQNKPTPDANRLKTFNHSSPGSSIFHTTLTLTMAKTMAMGVNTPHRVGTALDFDQSEASNDPPIIEARTAKRG